LLLHAVVRSALFFSLLAAGLAAASSASAQESGVWSGVVRERPARHDGEISLDVRDYWLRAMPKFSLSDPTQIGVRAIGTGVLPSTGEQHFLGFAFDTKYIYEQRWEFPIFGMVFGGAVGQSPRVISSLDGTMVEMKPWTAGTISLLLPGVGVRIKARRWMFSANARFVASWVWEQAAYASGRSLDDSPAALWAGTFGVRGHVEACRRLDVESRLCLFAEPHLYEFGFMNGGSAGLRWEYGK